MDLLLVIDNSPNTDELRALFGATAPYLVSRFAHPACVNGLGNVVATTTNDTDPCPDGQREFQPVQDVHIAVVTSSLGGHGADTCSPASADWNTTQNDAGHLITRGPGGATVATYQGQGFLAWDPAQKLSPPGESDIGALGQSVTDLASGAGEAGCGFEATLESMYRFLVDPEPYLTIPVVDHLATPTGIDMTVLQQRSDFLRPDSALVVVVVTDEDDCSVIEGNEYYFALQGLTPGAPTQLFHLPPPRTVCATNPDDPCCTSYAASQRRPSTRDRSGVRRPRARARPRIRSPCAASIRSGASASTSSTPCSATSTGSPTRPSPPVTARWCRTRSTPATARPSW